MASLIFFGLIWLLQRGHRRVRKWLANRLLLQKGLVPHSWRQVTGNVEVRLLGLITLLLIFMLTYGWLTYVLGLFPQTRAWSYQLGESLFALCGDMLEGMIAAILNAKGDSLRRRWEGNFAGASAPLVLNVLLDHLQRCSAARARKVRA